MPFWKYLMWPLAFVWGLFALLRNWLYDSNFLNGAEFEVPIISIGNLSMGGSGKTPMTEYFILHFKEIFNMAILSRGYRRKSSGFRIAEVNDNYTAIGDEPRQIKAKFSDIVVAVGESRALAIPQILSHAPQTNLIILDDAFQHRSVKPALNILLTPYHEPFWKDQLFPMGWLREHKANSKRADIIIVTKCPAEFNAEDEAKIKSEFQPAKDQKLFYSTLQYHLPYQLFNPENVKPIDLNSSILLFCGIADGKQLNEYLSTISKEVFWVEFDDHYNYQQRDLETLKETYFNLESPNKMIITTEKDAVRLEPYMDYILKEGIEIFCLPIQVKLVGSNKDQFDNLVFQFINFYNSAN
ncbi:MAG: tetraacyldisaccharide 4'-kinase [Chitinophagales bacterium]